MTDIAPGDLDVFVAVVRHRSFRKAATELRVTPSALSHALRALEERLAVRLVNRTTRSVAPTEAGQWLFDRVDPAFQDIETAIDDLGRFRGAPMGLLRLTAATSAARLVLMPIVARFLAAHPSVSVEIVAQTALVDVVSGGFDAGVRFGETIAADMVAVPIGETHRFAAVASPGYFERWPRPLTPRELRGLPCIRHRFDSGLYYHWEFERGDTALEIEVEGPFATNSHELMLDAALDGIGIAFVFEGMAAPFLASRRLIRVLDDWCPAFPRLHLYFPSRRRMPGALRAFIDFARAGSGAEAVT